MDSDTAESWTCPNCGLSYSMSPQLVKRERTYHGKGKCGTKDRIGGLAI